MGHSQLKRCVLVAAIKKKKWYKFDEIQRDNPHKYKTDMIYST